MNFMGKLIQAWELFGTCKWVLAFVLLIFAIRNASSLSGQERQKLYARGAAVDRADPNSTAYVDALAALQEQECKSQAVMAPALKAIVKRTGEFESEAAGHEAE
jgi:hypothetical protein